MFMSRDVAFLGTGRAALLRFAPGWFLGPSRILYTRSLEIREDHKKTASWAFSPRLNKCLLSGTLMQNCRYMFGTSSLQFPPMCEY